VKAPAELLVVGSIALDHLEGSFGAVDGQLGGSALYFALAASLLRPVRLHAPVGRDGEEAVRATVGGRPIDLEGLAVVDAPTYRWRARDAGGRNVDLGSDDRVYSAWRPSPPSGFSGWAFVGSLPPRHQLDAAIALPAARLVAADAMKSYAADARATVHELIQTVGWFFCNEEEARTLGEDPADPARLRMRWGLEGLCLKVGARGAIVSTRAGSVSLPAAPVDAVDTTGAGDALAGGFLASWSLAGGDPETLLPALAHGIACASFAVEGVGVTGLLGATAEAVRARADKLLEVAAAH
jgi:sugar/nucleoside kinase (ribokinase family)